MFRFILMLAFVLGFLFSSPNDCFAFDGQRRGFILGIGLGGGYSTFTQTNSRTFNTGTQSFTSARENKIAIISDFKIGYAPSNLVEIYWSSKVSWFGFEDVTIANSFGGLGITYHFNPQAPAPFINGGLGFSSWAAPFESGAESLRGTGFFAGGGYEFSPHWRLEGNLFWGKPDTDFPGVNISTSSFTFKVTLNVLAF